MSSFYLFRFYIQHRQKIILFLCLISNLGFLFMYFLVIYQPKKKVPVYQQQANPDIWACPIYHFSSKISHKVWFPT